MYFIGMMFQNIVKAGASKWISQAIERPVVPARSVARHDGVAMRLIDETGGLRREPERKRGSAESNTGEAEVVDGR
jgi:hypothetical protein